MYDKKRFDTSILFKTAYYNAYCTFSMFKVRLLTNNVFSIIFKKYNKIVITKNRNNSSNIR